jgi:hypothetical protein
MLGRRGLDILPMCIEAKSYYLKNAGYTLPLLYMEHDVKKKKKKKKKERTSNNVYIPQNNYKLFA